MRLLLDTHAFLWWMTADFRRLSPQAARAITDEENEVLVSAASAWEIATKHRLGKLPTASEIAPNIVGAIAGQGFDALPISVEDAQRAGAFPELHRDPFNRLLIAQALARNLVIVTNEVLFEEYGVQRLW